MKASSIRKLLFIMVLIIIAGITGSCVRESSTGPQAWIDSPRGGASIPLGVPVTVVSHAFAREGLAEIVLFVNGEAYQRSAPTEAGVVFSEFSQEWLPTEVGVHTLQVRAYDINGETGNPTTISNSVTGEVEVDEPETPPTETNTPVVSDTPTLTPIISDTPTLTPTFTVTTPPTNTPTLSPPTYTPTFTPTASATPVPVDNTPPPAPTPVVPADGLAVSCRSSQTLAWTPVTDPSRIRGYYVELEKEITAGSWQNAGEWGPISDKQIDVPVDCGIRYRWIVRAEDGAGNFSDWSSISHFAVNLD